MSECDHGSPYGACVLETCSHSGIKISEGIDQSTFRMIEARYPGVCDCGCGERFEETDTIMYGTEDGETILKEHFKEYARG